MISDKPVFSISSSAITHLIFTFDYMHQYSCMYCFVLAVIMSVFSSPVGSAGRQDLDKTYPMSLSEGLREDALHDLLERIDIHEGLVSPNPWSGRDTGQQLQRHCTQSFY